MDVELQSKACRDCGTVRPITSFCLWKKKYRAKVCNVCYHQRYGSKKKAIRNTPEGRAKRSTWNRQRDRHEGVKARERRHRVNYTERYPEKERAKRILALAVKNGEIERPKTCSACGADPGVDRLGRPLVHGHHPDYAKPLDVEWLCIACHATEHRALHPSVAEPDAPKQEQQDE